MGAALAVAHVDGETGCATVPRCVVACDVGRAINPQIIEGQIAGAATQGVGGALLEELAYSDEGQPLATSFMDYLMPTAAEAPAVEAVVLELPQHRPASANPLGVKGAGEAGIVGVGAAVANAVADALGARGAGLTALPLTPERLHPLITPGDA
jgi:carbon-monoxide dehydrogenase large subunit